MKLFMQMVEKYLAICEYQKNLNGKTIKAYRIDLRQFAEFSLETKADFSRSTIQTYMIQLNQRYKPRSVKRKIASLKAFFSLLRGGRIATK